MTPNDSVASKTATRAAVVTTLAVTAVIWVPSCATETDTPPTTSSSLSSTTHTTTQSTSPTISVYSPPPLTTGTPPTTGVTTGLPPLPHRRKAHFDDSDTRQTAGRAADHTDRRSVT